MRFSLLFPILAGLLGASVADGHELFFELRDEGLVLCRGHAELGGNPENHGPVAHPHGRQVVPAAQIRSGWVFEVEGAIRNVIPAADSTGSAVWPADARALLVTVSSGDWSKTRTGTVNLPRAEAEGALASWRSIEAIQKVNVWDPRLVEARGDAFQLTPRKNPLVLKTGEKLEMVATLEGQPMPDAIVTYGDRVRGTTGPDGTIRIRLREPGRQVIGATVRVPYPNGPVDEIVYTTLLVFRLEQP